MNIKKIILACNESIKKNNFKKMDIAKKSGIAYQNLTAILSGKRAVSLSLLIDLMRACKIPEHNAIKLIFGDKFFSDLAHNVNNPLEIAILNAEILKKYDLSADQKNIRIGEIIKSIFRISEYIKLVRGV